ncbi:MAG: DUF721 domain-containing protein [Bacteroidota bacterium]|nr:DUF721 domain-containing protein [Bacteroidota bacterium]
MRRSQTQGISDLIKLMKKQYHLENGVDRANIKRNWEQVVGKNAAAYTDRIYFRDRTMVVHLRSSILRHELTGQRKKLIYRINEQVGRNVIDDIILK